MSICWGLSIGCKWSSALPLLACFSYGISEAVKEPSKGKALSRLFLFFFIVPFSVYCLCNTEYISQYGFIGFLGREAAGASSFISCPVRDPSSSPWWTWLPIVKPLVIYRNTVSADNGDKFYSALVLMGNPLLWWAGIPSVLALLARGMRDALPRFVLFSVIFELLFWGLSPREGYIYYILNFTAVMMIAISYHLQSLWEKGAWGRAVVCLFIAVTVLSFAFFSPLLYGTPVNSDDYGRFNLTGQWSL
jgi:dolichyl-phosphate-mannose--protein O-mannosyl transferase